MEVGSTRDWVRADPSVRPSSCPKNTFNLRLLHFVSSSFGRQQQHGTNAGRPECLLKAATLSREIKPNTFWSKSTANLPPRGVSNFVYSWRQSLPGPPGGAATISRVGVRAKATKPHGDLEKGSNAVESRCVKTDGAPPLCPPPPKQKKVAEEEQKDVCSSLSRCVYRRCPEPLKCHGVHVGN